MSRSRDITFLDVRVWLTSRSDGSNLWDTCKSASKTTTGSLELAPRVEQGVGRIGWGVITNEVVI